MTPTVRVWLGSAAALLSAVSFASNVPFVALVYQHGGSLHAVNLVRPLFFFTCVCLWIAARPRRIDLPARQGNFGFLLGALFCLEFYGTHSAIKYISVGLAILIMYTYPIIVAILASVMNRERLSWKIILAMLVAFAGLAIAIGAPTDNIDWRGVAWSVGAAFGMCAIVTISERTTAGHDNAAVMFHTMLSASLIMLGVVLLGVPIDWPDNPAGYHAMIASTLLYGVATVMLFISVDIIGPVRFAVIDNTSPIWATLMGYLLLSETLSWQQGVGALLVICGVVAVQVLYSSDRT
jgi:drug/metabolite transporter (DMT)-like permease